MHLEVPANAQITPKRRADTPEHGFAHSLSRALFSNNYRAATCAGSPRHEPQTERPQRPRCHARGCGRPMRLRTSGAKPLTRRLRARCRNSSMAPARRRHPAPHLSAPRRQRRAPAPVPRCRPRPAPSRAPPRPARRGRWRQAVPQAPGRAVGAAGGSAASRGCAALKAFARLNSSLLKRPTSVLCRCGKSRSRLCYRRLSAQQVRAGGCPAGRWPGVTVPLRGAALRLGRSRPWCLLSQPARVRRRAQQSRSARSPQSRSAGRAADGSLQVVTRREVVGANS